MPNIILPFIDPVALSIGPLSIKWYSLSYFAGLLLGLCYCMYLVRDSSTGPKKDDFYDFFPWALAGIMVGGRLFYVLIYVFDRFLQDPVMIFRVWEGGMSSHGGMIGLIVATFLFCDKRGLSAYIMGDLIAAAAPIGLFLGRVANFVNGELYGRPVENLPWAMVFPQDPLSLPRHPSQLYQAGLEGILLFMVLAVAIRIPFVRQRPGMTSGFFFIGYAGARVFAEFFRQPDRQIGFLYAGTTMGQVLSLPILVLGIWLIARARFQA